MAHKRFNSIDERLDALKSSSANRSLSNQIEPYLDLVEPGSIRRRVMDMVPGMGCRVFCGGRGWMERRGLPGVKSVVPSLPRILSQKLFWESLGFAGSCQSVGLSMSLFF